MEALSGSLTLELAQTRISTIRPGLIDTDMCGFLPGKHRDGLRHNVRETFPAKRAGRVKGIGQKALFPISNLLDRAAIDVSGAETLFPQCFLNSGKVA